MKISNHFCCPLIPFLEKLFSTICWHQVTLSSPAPNNWPKSRPVTPKKIIHWPRPPQSHAPAILLSKKLFSQNCTWLAFSHHRVPQLLSNFLWEAFPGHPNKINISSPFLTQYPILFYFSIYHSLYNIFFMIECGFCVLFTVKCPGPSGMLGLLGAQ